MPQVQFDAQIPSDRIEVRLHVPFDGRDRLATFPDGEREDGEEHQSHQQGNQRLPERGNAGAIAPIYVAPRW